MIFEVWMVLFILATIIGYVMDPPSYIYKKYGGQSPDCTVKDKDGKIIDTDINKFICFMLFLVGSFIEIIVITLTMLWIASKGVVFAKYYAFCFIGYLVIGLFIGTQKKVVPTGRNLFEKFMRLSTTIIELGLASYALWMVI